MTNSPVLVCFVQGYYKDPVKTAEALDADGWLHSGDVGIWDSRGCLRIVDRKKNIFKISIVSFKVHLHICVCVHLLCYLFYSSSKGEYIAAEKIENVYAKSPFVGQSFVFGDSLHAGLVAIIVPNEDRALEWAAANAPEPVRIGDEGHAAAHLILFLLVIIKNSKQ